MNFYHEFRKSLQNVGILIAKMNNLESMQQELDTDSAEAEPLEFITKEVNNNKIILNQLKPEDDYSEYVSIRLKIIRENCKTRYLRELFDVPYQREYFEII